MTDHEPPALVAEWIKLDLPASDDYRKMFQTTGEYVWAKRLADSRYRVENTPWYCLWVRTNDVVDVIPTGETLETEMGEVLVCEVVSVVERSGHSTYHIVFIGDDWQGRWDSLWPRLEQRGCTFEENNTHNTMLFAVDAPPAADRATIDSLLAEGEEAELWLWASSGE